MKFDSLEILQGESVLDLVHKGSCANHIRDITKFLNAHLTINASTIDDLDEDVILKKLSNISSSYNFQERIVPNDEKFTVGTNYSKIVPEKEISTVKRDEFWAREEESEKSRIAAESDAKRLSNLKIEEERCKREQNEHAKREQMNKIAAVKKAAVAEIKPMKTIERVDESAKPRAEEMRTERRKEAQELIGNKVNAAKMMFQQQAAAQVPAKSAPTKPIRKTIHKIEPEVVKEIPPPISPAKEPEKVEEQEPEPEIIPEIQQPVTAIVDAANVEHFEDEQFSTIKRSPKTPTTPDNDNDNSFIEPNAMAATDNKHSSINQHTDNVQQQNFMEEHLQPKEQQQIVYNDPPQQIDESDDQPMLKAIALYDYQAVDDTEISFDPGNYFCKPLKYRKKI